MEKINSAKGYLMITGAGMCWASTGIFSTFLFRQGIDPLTVAFGRLTLGATLFLLLILVKDRTLLKVKARDLPLLFVIGLVSVAFFNFCYLQAISRLGVSISVVLLYTAPAFVIIISRAILKELITPVKVGALFLTISGVVLVTGVYDPKNWILDAGGILLGLGAGLAFAMMNILSKLALRKHESYTVTFYFTFFGAALFTLIHPPWLLLSAEFSPSTLPLFFIIAFISTFMAYLLFTGGMKYLEASRASITAAVEPVAAFTLAALFLEERLVPLQFAGFLCVIAAVLLLVSRR